MSARAHAENLAELLALFPGMPVMAGDEQARPHLHLYHAPNSICSQKVRATLAALRQPYVSHTLDLQKGESYVPAYVRVRLDGCRSAGLKLASSYPGTNSVAKTGCDACVVPTVIDDSRHICIELDRRNVAAPGALIPDDLRSAIMAELEIVDDLPNFQLLSSTLGKPSDDAPGNAVSLGKATRMDKLLEEHGHDAFLRAAYEAKRDKERAAANNLFSETALAHARVCMTKALQALDQRLRDHSGSLLFGDRATMADLFWAVELVRAEDLGLAVLWADGRLPSIAQYYRAVCALPAIRDSVLEWPGARIAGRVSMVASS